MRLSQSLFVTTREVPGEAELRSHQLLLRAGYVRRVGPGLYASLPLMQRVLRKLESIVRAEMEAVGAQEVAFPLLQPAEPWRESGRLAIYTREGLLFTLRDRAGREGVLAPTHEEVAALLARDLIRSHRQLPQTVYQIGHKFRDELRPRGLMLRAREFVMKDAYSFHEGQESLHATFEAMSAAYGRILTRLDLPWHMIEADSGAIGGSGSREFAVLSAAGEDEVLLTEGGHAANAERAESLPDDAGASPFARFERRHTPGTTTVAALNCPASAVVKNVLYEATFSTENGDLLVPVLVSLRGDGEVNTAKLTGVVAGLAGRFGGTGLVALEVARPQAWTTSPLPLGSLAPSLPDTCIARRPGVWPGFLRLADRSVVDLSHFATGANEVDWHVVGANWGEQFALPEVVDVWQARAGERSRHDPTQRWRSARGIEVGHVFQLGTRYTAALGVTFAGSDGRERPLLMGCYGLGLSRLAQTVAEVHADERGLVWPEAIAPFEVLVTLTNGDDAGQRAAGEALYTELQAAGFDVAFDDRDERAGVKLRDADLLGIPWRVTVGRGLRAGLVDLTERKTGQAAELPPDEVASRLTRPARAHLFPRRAQGDVL